MSLIFDIEKDKNIAMMVETSGIEDPTKLEFTFNIKVGGIKYGFPCKLKEGKVEICIPPLNTVVHGKIKSGEYEASLDVTGDKNYFLQPFNEKVTLKREPKVEVIVDAEGIETNVKEAITASISKIIDHDKKTPVVTETSDNKDISNTDDGDSKKSVTDKMFE
jgi:hypothetical protein